MLNIAFVNFVYYNKPIIVHKIILVKVVVKIQGAKKLNRTAIIMLMGALLGAMAFFIINSWQSLDVTNDTWLLNGYIEQDITQHYTGWLFYRQSPMTFPIGLSQNMYAPEGLSVTYTDSIPIFAVIFKLFSPVLPQTFQYFGIYNLLCYMLQGASGALLLSLFCKSNVSVILGDCLFILSPIMIERSFRHTALASHFLIIFALYIYFKNLKSTGKLSIGYLLLLGFATAIHIYFVPMIFAIMLADLLQHAIKEKKFVKPFLFLCAGFATVFAVAFLLGIFSTPMNGGSGGYGFFCMNLNAVFNPTSAGGFVWSRAIRTFKQTLGNYDAFNYLGLGVLLGGVIGGVTWLVKYAKKEFVPFVKTNYALIAVCVCLTVFAISRTVTANSYVLFEIPFPAFLQNFANIFRSSGRMFYPVYYLALLFVVVFFANRFGNKIGIALLTVILAIQIWDISPALTAKREMFTKKETTSFINNQSTIWQCLKGKYSKMFSFTVVDATYPALFAAQNGMSSNIQFAARTAKSFNEITDNEFKKLLNGQIDTDTIYIADIRLQDLFIPLGETLKDKADIALVSGKWFVVIPKKQGVYLPQNLQDATLYPDIEYTLLDELVTL